jgi:hypothetical protein
MCHYRNADGTRRYPPHRGQVASETRIRRFTLVRNGLASWWFPYRSVEGAIAAAGLQDEYLDYCENKFERGK